MRPRPARRSSTAKGAAFAETAVVTLVLVLALLVAPTIPGRLAEAIDALRQSVSRAVRTSLP